jgi:anti-anti-sigma regulatory factor
MDSRAVGGLIYLSKTMHNSGIELIMRGPNNHIRKLFKDCSLDEILTVENGRDAEGINTTVGWREE